MSAGTRTVVKSARAPLFRAARGGPQTAGRALPLGRVSFRTERSSEVRSVLLLALILVLGVTLGSCHRPPATSTGPRRPRATSNRVDTEAKARQVVEAHIGANQIDVSRLEFYFAKEMDTRRMRTSGRVADFGPRIWLVRYGQERGADRTMRLGGGMLFWIDAETGRIVARPERD